MPATNQFGLLVQDDPNKRSTTAQAGGTPGAPDQPLSNPFQGTAPSLGPAGAGVVTPSVQQYAFNPKFSAMDQALQSRLADAGMQRGNDIGALDQQYTSQIQDSERQRSQAIKSLTDRFSSQGLLFSGINAGAQGDLQGDFQRYIGNLATNRANALGGIEREFGGTIRDVNQQRAGMWGQQGSEEESARLQAAQQAQQAQQAEAQAAAMQQLQQQMIQQQQQALAAPPSGGGGGSAYSTPTPHSAVPAGNPAMDQLGSQDYGAVMGMINASGDLNQLNHMGTFPGLPIEVTQALMRRIQMLQQTGGYDNRVKNVATGVGAGRAY